MALKGTFGNAVVIDPVKLAEYMRGSNGPVARDMLERGELVKREAQRLVGVYKPPPGSGGRRDSGGRFLANGGRARKPGTLRDSIVKRLVDIGGMPACLVGSEDPIALWHHEGTEPHVIEARNAPRLVFFWPKVGAVVSFKRVNHPGTKPNRFLTNALAVLRGR